MTQLSTDRSPLFERQTATDDTAGAAPSNADATPDTLPQLFEKVERAKQVGGALTRCRSGVRSTSRAGWRGPAAPLKFGAGAGVTVHGRNFHQLMHPPALAS
jgi:hypothetical protein